MMPLHVIAVTLLIGLLAGCAASRAQMAVPAVLSDVDEASRAALANAVTQALNGREVLLASDALTQSSRLVLDPARPKDTNGRLLQGREMRPPESFRLLKQGDECVLQHERTGRKYVLQQAHCAAETR